MDFFSELIFYIETFFYSLELYRIESVFGRMLIVAIVSITLSSLLSLIIGAILFFITGSANDCILRRSLDLDYIKDCENVLMNKLHRPYFDYPQYKKKKSESIITAFKIIKSIVGVFVLLSIFLTLFQALLGLYGKVLYVDISLFDYAVKLIFAILLSCFSAVASIKLIKSIIFNLDPVPKGNIVKGRKNE